jgi:hypothetical protein
MLFEHLLKGKYVNGAGLPSDLRDTILTSNLILTTCILTYTFQVVLFSVIAVTSPFIKDLFFVLIVSSGICGLAVIVVILVTYLKIQTLLNK